MDSTLITSIQLQDELYVLSHLVLLLHPFIYETLRVCLVKNIKESSEQLSRYLQS